MKIKDEVVARAILSLSSVAALVAVVGAGKKWH
jgi:hypothetical protein